MGKKRRIKALYRKITLDKMNNEKNNARFGRGLGLWEGCYFRETFLKRSPICRGMNEMRSVVIGHVGYGKKVCVCAHAHAHVCEACLQVRQNISPPCLL